ncbi:NAD-dependent epimerase/dehydratase family protein [Sphingobium naphthae]|nr:NAD-dependent epimerase/dehydratase family protein [Sphingobium naphthae]
MKNLKVLVIGGAGFIGSAVVKALVSAGAEVSVLDLLVGSQPNVQWIVGPLSDLSIVASAVVGVDVVVFLANASLPSSSHANMSAEISSHVLSTINVAEMAAGVGVKSFIFASSGGTVYGYSPDPAGSLREDQGTFPRNAYGVSKLAIEHYLRLLSKNRHIQTLSLRISNPYGEGQKATRAQGVVAAAMEHAYRGTRMLIWGDGSVERDFIHISDVAAAFTQACEYRGSCHVINIGSGVSIPLSRVLEKVVEASGRNIDIIYDEHRDIDVQCNRLDISLARAELAWEPLISLDEGLRRTSIWWAEVS